jgi:hypothetical protein
MWTASLDGKLSRENLGFGSKDERVYIALTGTTIYICAHANHMASKNYTQYTKKTLEKMI